MKLVYLGNWMANAIRTDDRIKKFEDLQSHVFSCAKDLGFDEYVDDEEGNDGVFYPTRSFEEETEVNQLRTEYNEDAFWSELPDKLGERDFYKKYSEKELKKMSQKEYFLKIQECIIKWEEEFEKNGIDRLGIVEK